MRPLRNHLAAATLMIAVASALAQARPAHAASKSLLDGLELFQIEPAHSPIEFSIAFMGLSRVRGAFADFTGAIALDPADLTRSSVTVVIHTRSLTTFNFGPVGPGLRVCEARGSRGRDRERGPGGGLEPRFGTGARDPAPRAAPIMTTRLTAATSALAIV